MRSVGAFVICVAFGLAGCTSYGWEKRHGIDPVLNPTALAAASSNHILILTALAQDANFAAATPADWYRVAEAGFNYIDDECRLYFNHLFFLNRERDQIKAGIIAATATTAAILGVTGASTKTMTIVAEAFGLGAVAADLIPGTYLYQLPPATTQGFVKQLHLAYREGAALRRGEINTSTAAYHAIQGYLALCLPPTIEAKVAEHIATARAFPDPATPRGGASIGITLASQPAMTRTAIRTAVIQDVRVPLREQVRIREPGSTKLDPFEESLSRASMAEIQIAVCVTPTGDLGPRGSPTRRAISDYFVARGLPASQGIVDRRNIAFLDEAVEKVRVRAGGTCATGNFANATAVGRSLTR